jgi:hypothetical protein
MAGLSDVEGPRYGVGSRPAEESVSRIVTLTEKDAVATADIFVALFDTVDVKRVNIAQQ